MTPNVTSLQPDEEAEVGNSHVLAVLVDNLTALEDRQVAIGRDKAAQYRAAQKAGFNREAVRQVTQLVFHGRLADVRLEGLAERYRQAYLRERGHEEVAEAPRQDQGARGPDSP